MSAEETSKLQKLNESLEINWNHDHTNVAVQNGILNSICVFLDVMPTIKLANHYKKSIDDKLRIQDVNGRPLKTEEFIDAAINEIHLMNAIITWKKFKHTEDDVELQYSILKLICDKLRLRPTNEDIISYIEKINNILNIENVHNNATPLTTKEFIDAAISELYESDGTPKRLTSKGGKPNKKRKTRAKSSRHRQFRKTHKKTKRLFKRI